MTGDPCHGLAARRRPWVIGVTGSFGTGKSTVAQMFARLGARVMDADALAHAALAQGRVVRQRLRRRFGDRILQRDGAIDRRALSRVGFASRQAWQDLCRIIHPAVVSRTRRWLTVTRRQAPSAVAVLEVPLLIESGMTSLVDWVVVVTASPQAQRRRLQRLRRWPLAEVRRRVRWQLPLAEKVRVADVVIDNGGSRRATAAQVRQFWRWVHDHTKESDDA